MTSRRSSAEASALALGAWLATSLAAAQAPRSVVVMLDGRAPELAEALQLELGARGLELRLMAPPAPGGALARAAAAQEAARGAGALAALWVEEAPVGGGATVRAVGVTDDAVRHAPLPAPLASVEARVVALVAASLLDELVAPDGGGAEPVTVRVAVDVRAPGRTVEVVPMTPPAPSSVPPPPVVAPPPVGPPRAPAASAPVDAIRPDDDTPLLSRDGWNLEAGVFFAGLAAGGTVTLARWLDDAWRLGPTANLAFVLVDDLSPAGTLGATLLRAGRARSGRFDFGVHAGVVMVPGQSTTATTVGGGLVGEAGTDGTGDTTTPVRYASETHLEWGWTAEALFGWGWELSASLALDLRFALGAAQVDGGEVVPVAWSTFALELPL